MKVYLNRIEHTQFPSFYWKRGGKFFLRLVAINAARDKAEYIEPVYSPVLSIDRIGKMTFIEIGWNVPHLLIVFSPWRPFIHIERTDVIEMEDA